MFWPILIILYIGIIAWVLLYLIKLHKFSLLVESDFKQEEKTFVFSRRNEFSDPMEQKKIGPGKTFVFIEKADKPEIKPETKKRDEPFPLYDEKHAKSLKTPVLQRINIANVTKELICYVMKMSEEDKHWLTKEKASRRQRIPNHVNSETTAKYLIEMIMRMSLEDRCALLSELKSRMGASRRKFARKNYMSPVYYVVKGMLQNAYTKNFSSDGLLIETLKVTRHLSPGESITMSLLHPRFRKEMKIHGKIIRVTPGAIAVYFDKPL